MNFKDWAMLAVLGISVPNLGCAKKVVPAVERPIAQDCKFYELLLNETKKGITCSGVNSLEGDASGQIRPYDKSDPDGYDFTLIGYGANGRIIDRYSFSSMRFSSTYEGPGKGQLKEAESREFLFTVYASPEVERYAVRDNRTRKESDLVKFKSLN